MNIYLPHYRRRLVGSGTKSAIVTPSTTQMSSSMPKSTRLNVPDSSLLNCTCVQPAASANDSCVCPVATRSSRSFSVGVIPQYTRNEYASQPTRVLQFRARKRPLLVTNVLASLSAMKVAA